VVFETTHVRFLTFFKIQKHDFTFFELLLTFSQTVLTSSDVTTRPKNCGLRCLKAILQGHMWHHFG